MTTRKKPADAGTLLQKVKSPESLKPWAELVAGAAGPEADALYAEWVANWDKLQFFSAADPKIVKHRDFGYEYGLIAFAVDHARALLEPLCRGVSLPEVIDQAGLVRLLATKPRHKSLSKLLLGAAERVISEKHSHVIFFTDETSQTTLRTYKASGFEEVARVNDRVKPGSIELILTKNLAS